MSEKDGKTTYYIYGLGLIAEASIDELNYDNITIPSSAMECGSANRLVDFNGTALSYDNDENMFNTPLKTISV